MTTGADLTGDPRTPALPPDHPDHFDPLGSAEAFSTWIGGVVKLRVEPTTPLVALDALQRWQAETAVEALSGELATDLLDACETVEDWWAWAAVRAGR